MALWAMAFPEWRCHDCRMTVAWQDAQAITEDGKLVGFIHVDCVEPESAGITG